jgi:hypothetical protein
MIYCLHLQAAVERAVKHELEDRGPDPSERVAILRREDWYNICAALAELQANRKLKLPEPI